MAGGVWPARGTVGNARDTTTAHALHALIYVSFARRASRGEHGEDDGRDAPSSASTRGRAAWKDDRLPIAAQSHIPNVEPRTSSRDDLLAGTHPRPGGARFLGRKKDASIRCRGYRWSLVKRPVVPSA